MMYFIHFDLDTALMWALQTNYTLPILILWPFPKNACISGWSYCSLYNKNA